MSKSIRDHIASIMVSQYYIIMLNQSVSNAFCPLNKEINLPPFSAFSLNFYRNGGGWGEDCTSSKIFHETWLLACFISAVLYNSSNKNTLEVNKRDIK